MKAEGHGIANAAINVLNSIYKNGGEHIGELAKADFITWNLTVDPTYQGGELIGPLHQDGKIVFNEGKTAVYMSWNPNLGYVDENDNAHSAASILYHESRHGKLRYEEAKTVKEADTKEEKRQAISWYQKRIEWSGGGTKKHGYENNEEYHVTREEANYQQKHLGEKPRPNHIGNFFKTRGGSFSNQSANGTPPKYRRPQKR